jgi:hypothetical protein
MEVSGQLGTLAALPLEKDSQYPLYRRLGGAQSQSGNYGEEKNLLPLWESNPDFLVIQPIA